MEDSKTYLQLLLGKTLSRTEMGSSTTFAINNNRQELSNARLEISLQLVFEEYFLEIYNPIAIVPSNKELHDFIGLRVIDANEEKNEAELVFDNGFKIIVNMRDEVYYGPEAMYLSGPNNFWVVWN